MRALLPWRQEAVPAPYAACINNICFPFQEQVTTGLKDFLIGNPCPFDGLDEYFELLKLRQQKVYILPSFFLNEILLCCKTKRKNCKGFSYEKALKDPWKFTIEKCAEYLKAEPGSASLQEVKYFGTNLNLIKLTRSLFSG